MFVPIIKYEAACLFEIEEKLSPNLGFPGHFLFF